MNWLLNWHWWRTRARWIDRFAPVPSVMLALPILLVVAWDAVQTLQMGFWIDECGAYWLSQHLSSLLRPPFGFSNFGLPYAAVLSLFAWAEPPWFETVARLPSLLSSIGCAAVLYFLSEKWNGRGTGWIAALIFILLPRTLDHATEARPYALSQFTFAITLWTLQGWLARGGPRLLAMHGLLLVLLVYLHPFWALVWPLAWLFVVSTRPDLRIRYSLMMLGAATLLAPVAWMALNGSEAVRSIAFLPPPSVRNLPVDVLQDRVGIAVLAVIAAAWLWGERLRPTRAPIGFWVALSLAWPLVLFALARITGSTFYLQRYCALSGVGFAMLAAGALSTLRPSLRYAAALLVIVLHVTPGSRARQLRDGDIRPLASWLQTGDGHGAPWLANSQFVEGRVLDPLPPAVQLERWKFAHVSTYPVTNPVFPMPSDFQELARPALEAQLDGPWLRENRILAGPFTARPPEWLLAAFAQRGYRYTQLGLMHEFAR